MVKFQWRGSERVGDAGASLTGNGFLGLRASLKGQGFELRCRERLFLGLEGH
jgi:hypothetical protein